MRRNSIWVVVCVWFLSSLVGSLGVAEDLNYREAERKYNEKQSIADSAKRVWEAAEREFVTARSRFDRAQSRAIQADQDLKDAQNHQRWLTSEINRLTNSISSYQSQVQNLDAKRKSLRSEIDQLRNQRPAMVQELRRLGNRRQNLNAQIQEEAAKENPDQQKLKRLRRQRDNVKSKWEAKKREVDQLDRKLANKRSERDRVVSNLNQAKANRDNAISSKQSYLAQRDQQKNVIARARDEVQRANQNLQSARRDFNAAKTRVDNAYSDYEAKERLAQQAYDYWQQVLANYEAAKQEVIEMASSAGWENGAREGDERAETSGTTAGSSKGDELGYQVGVTHSKEVARSQGYKRGRETGATTLALKDAYSAGLEAGIAHANDKAQKESFPKGYNEALSALLGSTPNGVAEIDLSAGEPFEPGGNGRALSALPLGVGQKPAPRFQTIEEPSFDPPSNPGTSVSIPGRNNTYFSPPCQGLKLAEFGPLCQGTYENNYLAGYKAQYEATYEAAFGEGFRSTVEAAYRRGRSEEQPSSEKEGAELGAEHLGVLNGYALRIELAITEAYQAGRKQLTSQLSTGHMVFLRESKFVDENGDGLFSAGEKVSLTIVVDNFGKVTSETDGFRLRVVESEGVTLVGEELQVLPPFKGDTRTTVKSAVQSKVNAAQAGANIQLKIALEQLSGGRYQTMSVIEVGKELRFPIELTSLSAADGLQVNEWSEAVLTYKNQTDQSTSAVSLALSADANIIELKSEGLEVPVLQPGEEVEIPVEAKVTARAGGSPTELLSKVDDPFGEGVLAQLFSFIPNVKRNASLYLGDRSSRPIVTGRQTVRAGSTANVRVVFKFQADRELRGPFSIRHVDKSSNKIRFPNGATTGVSFQSWSPSWGLHNSDFRYIIPSELRGQSHWVKYELKQGESLLHELIVGLDVQ